jgi:hypothetical protein
MTPSSTNHITTATTMSGFLSPSGKSATKSPSSAVRRSGSKRGSAKKGILHLLDFRRL